MSDQQLEKLRRRVYWLKVVVAVYALLTVVYVSLVAWRVWEKING